MTIKLAIVSLPLAFALIFSSCKEKRITPDMMEAPINLDEITESGNIQKDVRERSLPTKISGDVFYVLKNAEELHKQSPKTFWIPSRERRSKLIKGDLVKLVFEITNGVESRGERMWVIVEEVGKTGYKGVLDNDPHCTDDLKAGELVEFKAKHVIDIYE